MSVLKYKDPITGEWKNVSTGGGTGQIPSVKRYGAKGDGVTDDTAAFQTALAENRTVFVPGGTYLLSGELVIGDNSMLELSQDTVLQFTQTTGNCISLGMSSAIKGNHATIKVPYSFGWDEEKAELVDANVIYASTKTTENANAVPPFRRWDPQWKAGRYVTDLNICKADFRGFHYSVDGRCSGVAVYLSADGDKGGNTGPLTFMWGVHYSGLRIAGAFVYGIRAENFNKGWLHEMRIDAFIEACEVGVSLVDCNNAYISAIIQPKCAYSEDAVYIPYAKHGIELIRSKNADLSGSRVWDWDENRSLYSAGGPYQHISMIGDCSGTILNDFRYYATTDDTRKRIYTDDVANLEKLTILQEPITRWFKPKGGVPYFSGGFAEREIITDESLGYYFKTNAIRGFDNKLLSAIGSDGEVYNGTGYKTNTRLDSNGVELPSAYYVTTGFIPCIKGDIIYAKEMSFAEGDQYCRVILYDADKNYVLHVNRGILVDDGGNYSVGYTSAEEGFTLQLKNVETLDNVAYARFTFYKTAFGSAPMIAVNEETKYTAEGYLGDGIKVKAENIEGTENQGDFKSVDGVPYYSDGSTDYEIMTDESMKQYFDTGMVKSFTDVLASATDASGNIYNGVGYVTNTGFYDSAWNNYAEETHYFHTGFIPVKAGDVIRGKGLSFNKAYDGNCRVYFYDSSRALVTKSDSQAAISASVCMAGGEYFVTYEGNEDSFELTVKAKDSGGWAINSSVAYVRFQMLARSVGDYPMMSVNEEIDYTVEGFLRDEIKVKGESVILTSPSGKAYRITVSDSGTIAVTSVTINEEIV